MQSKRLPDFLKILGISFVVTGSCILLDNANIVTSSELSCVEISTFRDGRRLKTQMVCVLFGYMILPDSGNLPQPSFSGKLKAASLEAGGRFSALTFKWVIRASFHWLPHQPFLRRRARLLRKQPIRMQVKPATNNNARPSVAITNKIVRNVPGCMAATALENGSRPNKPTMPKRMPIGTSLDLGGGVAGAGVVICLSGIIYYLAPQNYPKSEDFPIILGHLRILHSNTRVQRWQIEHHNSRLHVQLAA